MNGGAKNNLQNPREGRAKLPLSQFFGNRCLFRSGAFYCLAVVFAMLFFSIAPTSKAADLTPEFDAANKLYEEGHFADAVSAYEKILASGKVSEALYFNRGNALFKLGQLGRAIASYRQAMFLAPRDSALRANLQFARTRARGGSPYHGERWREWLNSLSLNEWTWLTAAAFWTVFVLLAMFQWQHDLQHRLQNWLIASVLAALVFASCLGLVIVQDYFTTTAIVVAGEAEVRNGPLDESPGNFKVRDGIELEVVDRKDNWLQVADSAQRTGWLRDDQAIIFEPAAARKSQPLHMLENPGK